MSISTPLRKILKGYLLIWSSIEIDQRLVVYQLIQQQVLTLLPDWLSFAHNA
ncbi:hypothetical protein [Spirosoma flavum]|uniref:Uncharacterized protein n=1 Tax=Spirosoma flavum TaxID=2048557 RepID=A0ABW6ALL4_9BACT